MLIDIDLNSSDRVLKTIYPNSPKRIGKGLYLSDHWNFEMYLPDEKSWEDFFELEECVNCYGVCDSSQQFMEKVGHKLDLDTDHHYVVSFVHLRKADMDPVGGWRWHKWGPYIGDQKPEYEYLYDEPVIEEVYTYHFYRKKVYR